MSLSENGLKQEIKNITLYTHIGMRKWKSVLAIFFPFGYGRFNRVDFKCQTISVSPQRKTGRKNLTLKN